MAFERDLEGASIYGSGSVPSWRDHSDSSEKVKQRAVHRWGTAARQRQYSAQRPWPVFHAVFHARVLVPKSSADCLCTWPITVLATAAQTWAHCAAEHHPWHLKAIALHSSPLTSFQSHVWPVCCLPCLNFLSHQSSAPVLSVILKWTSVWQQ